MPYPSLLHPEPPSLWQATDDPYLHRRRSNTVLSQSLWGPFRYDLNQIPYDYTVEVRNRFMGLDLIDREPDELWTEVRDIVQEPGIKTIPKKKKCKKVKWLSRGLTNSCEKKISKKQRRKGKIFPFECRAPKNSKEIRKPYSSINAKRKTTEWERLEISSRKLEVSREHVM